MFEGVYEAQVWGFEAGDIDIDDESTHHMLALDPAEEGICLTYTESKIKPKNRLVRLLQPFIGL